MNVKLQAIGNEGDICGALSTVGDAIGDLAIGLPAPIRKNVFAALGRLMTAVVDYPVARMEGVVAELRAESNARVAIINASGSQFVEHAKVSPEYILAANDKFSKKIVRECVNIDKISKIAIEELKSKPLTTFDGSEVEVPPISEDWLNAFENESAKMSSEQMQRLFGKILAGEIQKPTSYSIKTLKLMAQLDNRAAELFRLLCSISISTRDPISKEIYDARVVSMGDAGGNSLKAYGLTFTALNILHEYGLIISSYNSCSSYAGVVAHENKIRSLPITYQNAQWVFFPKVVQPIPQQEFDVFGIAFSRSGKELLSIVEVELNESYTVALKNFFDQQGMTMMCTS